MKRTIILIASLIPLGALCQKKADTTKHIADTVNIEIPARQQGKIAEIDKAIRELQARREDILLDLLAVPENAARVKDRRFARMLPNKMQFVK